MLNLLESRELTNILQEMARGTEAPLTQLEMDREAMIKRNESILDAAIKSGCPQDSEISPERLQSVPSPENITTPRSSQNRQNSSNEGGGTWLMNGSHHLHRGVR